MQFSYTRMAGFMLAFGIFFTISCTSLKNTEAEQQSAAESTNTFDQQLIQLNEAIQKDLKNSQPRFKKAELLASRARTVTPPASRLPLYTSLYHTAENARMHTPRVSNQIDTILERAWNTEQNAAIRLLQQSSPPSQLEYSAINDHLTNAITILPDNIESYRLLASTHYSLGFYSDAIQTIQQALSVISDHDNEIFFREKLAYLYLESGSGDEALEIYREIAAEKPELIQLRHGLVNALIISGYHAEAATVLKELMEEFPKRTSYQEALAMENYHQFLEEYESLMNINSADMEPGDLLILLETSHEIYTGLENEVSMREELTFNAAVFYKQAVSKLEQLAAIPGLTINSLDQMISEYRSSALLYWERLAKFNPDNTEYMFNLYELYVQLDLSEEARQLEETYNFNAL